jgi:sortase B
VYETYPDARGAVSVAETIYSYITTDFKTDNQYVNFLEELKAKSKFAKDITITPDSRIITLSTCTNNWRDTRFAVHGVLVEIIRDNSAE